MTDTDGTPATFAARPLTRRELRELNRAWDRATRHALTLLGLMSGVVVVAVALVIVLGARL